MNDLCAAIGQAYGNYYKQLPRIRVKGRHNGFALKVVISTSSTNTTVSKLLIVVTVISRF